MPIPELDQICSPLKLNSKLSILLSSLLSFYWTEPGWRLSRKPNGSFSLQSRLKQIVTAVISSFLNNVSPIKCPVAITIFVAIVVDDNVVVVSIGVQ